MWTEINSDKDAEDFMKKIEITDDWESGAITEFKYKKNNISMIVEYASFKKIEMFFEGVHNFDLDRAKNFYLTFRTDLFGKTRDDRLLVLTDNKSVKSREDILNGAWEKNVIVASKIKYRFINIFETPDTDYSLKKIVEENYLVEIAWDYFRKNLDGYTKSDEAEKYGITSRESVKAYFSCYGFKYFPESEKTNIIITIKFNDTNNKYLGYYEIVFDGNLEIMDDFFIIE